MPNYPWLTEHDMDLSTVRTKLDVLAGFPMGTPYSAKQIENAEVDARAQAKLIADDLRKEPRLADAKELEKKEVIALIAYMQRMGTDIKKAAPAVAAPTAAGGT